MENKNKKLFDYVFPKQEKESWILAILKIILFLFLLPIIIGFALTGIHDGLSAWFN